MDWPRFKLTPGEARVSNKYEDPRSNKQRVLRRMYYNELVISPELRLDTAPFQISRRWRVFGLTAAGDVDFFRLELIDTTGEQYTAGPIHLVNLIGGYNPDPLSFDGNDWSAGPGTRLMATATDQGPFIQEPNILLAPNQTLNINASPALPDNNSETFRIGITLHVYEFPGVAGSPL